MKDITELHKVIDEIVQSRQLAKAKIDEKVLQDERSREILEEFHKPVVEQLKKQVPEVPVKQVEPPPVEPAVELPPVEPTVYEPPDLQTELVEAERRMSYDIDKNLQDEILNQYNLKLPGELLMSSDNPMPQLREAVRQKSLKW